MPLFVADAQTLVLNAKDYGLVGNGVADDTTAINNILLAAHNNGGGQVFVPYSTPLISAPLTIYSNTSLILASNTTITLAASSNCNMLINAAATAQRTVSDAAITTGITTLTSATANFTNADIGRTVCVTGAWTGSLILTTNIMAVTNSTTVTLSVAATLTVSGAACSIFTRDSHIEIAGGTWNRGNNGNASSGTVATNTTNLRHIDSISVHDTQFMFGTLKSYNLALVDVTNFIIKNITLNGPNTVFNTDGVCVDGPAQYGLIDGIYGTTGDDFVSLHTISLDNIAGNQSDIVVSNLFPVNIGQAAFKAHADSGTLTSSLTVRGVHGSALSGAIHLVDYTTPSTSSMTDILVEDVDCLVTTNSTPLIVVYCNNSTGIITLKDIVWRTNSGTSVQAIQFPVNSTLGTLVVDGLNLESANHVTGVYVAGTLSNLIVKNVVAPNSSFQFDAIVSCDTGAVVKTVMISDVVVYLNTNAQNPILTNKSTLKTAMFNNIYLNNGGLILLHKNAPSNCQVIMNNITLDSAYQLAQLVACAADMSLSNLNVYTTNQSALIGLTTAGSNLSIRGRGLINPNNKIAFTRDGTQTVRVVHPEMQADLSTLQNNAGDQCTNTNSGLSCGTGLCLANGTNWKNLYSGSIY